uniref:TUG ubiquitin-like domain-containing protein n=1 Tax=Photinus pyralis TaxID=7054 RepID=A0A1Y1LUR2_PHOPY
MEKAVTVLAPNGRRQTVKVNVNATVLQILEEVCKKQGLQPEKYDIKHHNKCLDTSTIIRFSGLPNNAQLELSEAVTERADGIVTLGIQCENGDRLTGDFDPGCNLHDVLCKMCPEQVDPETNPVVVYMRRMIYGETSFKETTLRSLGLTHGRAMLRLIHKSPEELGEQANISAPLPPRAVEEKLPERPREKPSVPKYQKVELPPPQQPPPAVDKPKAASPPRQLPKTLADDPPHQTVPVLKEKTVAEEDFIFVGPRNAMIFSQDTAEAVPSEDLPDDFFELTITDAKKLLKDLKKRRVELDNLPLQTSTWRSLLKSTDELTRMNRYKKSIIRIHFPDQMILQGVFKPLDTLQMVFDFVRDYLENRDLDFYLCKRTRKLKRQLPDLIFQTQLRR